MRFYKVLLYFGYLGFGNFGDELLLQLASADKTNFQTLSSKKSFWQHLVLISTCKELILLGGLFQDLTSIRSNLYYALVIFCAKICGKKISFLATGIGPLRSFISRIITRFAYSLGDEIGVRDKFSSEFLLEAKIQHQVVEDLVFSIEYDESKVNKAKLPQGQFDIVSINPYLEQIDTQGKLEILCDSLQKPSAHSVLNANDYNVHEIIYFLKNHCKSLITQRFHVAVLAIKAGTGFQTTIDCHKVMQLSTPQPGVGSY